MDNAPGGTFRVGLMVPSTDTTIEVDLYRNLPQWMTLHTSRMFLSGVTIADEERMLVEEVPHASRELASLDPDVVVFGCTSAGAIQGLDGDWRMGERIREIVGCPVLTTFGLVVEALRSMSPKRLFVLTPYVASVNDRLKTALEQGGVKVASMAGLGLSSDIDIGSLDPETILAATRTHLSGGDADCGFISCTNMRAWPILSQVSRECRIPVISSNFAVYWGIMRQLTGAGPDLGSPEYGNR